MFTFILYALCIFCAILYFYTRNSEQIAYTYDFAYFQGTYLVGYLLAAAGDWLQGPHVYALYESYGMSKHDIELLFVTGFGSSVIFGTFIGSFADKLGRRNNCILYALIYSGACVTKHFANFNILMIGRLLGGIATSILFSAFESWLVFEHNKRQYNSDLLSLLFSNATLGNSLIAILSGIVAQFAADHFGYVAPFDVSIGVLTLMTIFVVCTWTENYGDRKADYSHSFKEAWSTLKSDRKVLYLGIVQSLFEGAMYTFVLEWTPALTPSGGVKTSTANESSAKNGTSGEISGDSASIPHGYIFATFMVAIMIGSSLFRLLSTKIPPESFMRIVLLVSALCLVPPIILPNARFLIYAGFILFEICVGLFWPAIGFMRGIYLPETARSTVMNFFRVPLNLIVISILIQNLHMRTIFVCCVIFLTLASIAQCALHRARCEIRHNN